MLTEKKCSKCGEVKDFSEFTKQASKKDGLHPWCKTCTRAAASDYRDKIGHDEARRRNKESRLKHIDKALARERKYNKEHRKARAEYTKQHKKKHRKRYTEYENKRRREKIANDPIFKHKEGVRSLVKYSYTRKGFKKESKTSKILGCEWEIFEPYIEAQFTDGMTWENHGIDGWHYDHIIPISSANTIKEVDKLNHYTNIRPLWAKENLSKGNKMNESIQLKFI